MQRDDRLFLIVGLCLTTVVGGVAGILWLASSIDVDPPTRARVEVTPARRPTQTPAPAQAVLASIPPAAPFEGDELVRTLVSGISSHPGIASLLVHDRLVRRFVAAVNAIAGGYSPRDELDFLRPSRPFIVRDDDVAGLVIAAGSFRRYDLAAEVFASLDTEGAVEIYRRFEPTISEAHRKLSWGGGDFDDRLREAIDHLLEVEVPDGALPVERRTITYAFADDELEMLSDAQRQLLRMGSHNARTVQAKLRELRDELGWPDPRVDGDPPVTAIAEDPASLPPSQIAELAVSEPTAESSPQGDPVPELTEIASLAAAEPLSPAPETPPQEDPAGVAASTP